MTVRLVIPSRGRAELLAFRSLYIEAAHVVVDRPELESYRAAFAKFRRRPAELVGIAGGETVAEIRNQALDAVWTVDVDGVFFLDDDTAAVTNVCAYEPERLGVSGALAAIGETCAAAIEAGTGVCGFGNAEDCSSFVPISLIADIEGGALGVVDRELRFDRRACGVDDIELCLRAIQRYGFVWRDNRYRRRALNGMIGRRPLEEELHGIRHLNDRHGGAAGGNVVDVMPHARSARRTAAWRQVREQALARAKGRCEQCGCSGVDLDCHHVAPLRHGGEAFSLRNVLIVCEGCHAAISEKFAAIRKKRDVRGRWIPNERNTAWRALRGGVTPDRLGLRINFAEIGAAGP